MAEVPEIYRSDVNYDVATRDFKFYIFDWDDTFLGEGFHLSYDGGGLFGGVGGQGKELVPMAGQSCGYDGDALHGVTQSV